LECFIVGWPVPGLVGRGYGSAHASQLPPWIREMNPSSDLCNKAGLMRSADRSSSQRRAGSFRPVPTAVFFQIAKAGEAALKGQLDRADGTVALLADDHFGFAMAGLHDLLPGGHLVQIVIGGLFALAVILLAEDEHDDISVLFDTAGFAQVRKLWALVVARLDLTGQLRQGDDGDVQLFGDSL